MRSVNIKYAVGADSVKFSKLILMLLALFTVGQGSVWVVLLCAYAICMVCDHKWWRPWLDLHTHAVASAIRQLLAVGDRETAVSMISSFAWIRFFGHHPLILELMGQCALTARNAKLAETYFKSALIDAVPHDCVDAHFGVLHARLLANDTSGALKKASELRRLFEGDTFVAMRLEMLIGELD